MRRAAACVAITSVLLISASCGAESDESSPAQDASVATEPTVKTAAPPVDQVGSLGDAVEVAAGAPGRAEDAACTVDRQTLETASELYETLNGSLPPSQIALVDAQLLRELSPRFEITTDGAIVPAPGSPCL